MVCLPQVKDVDWDHTLGCNSLDTLLAAHFAAQFAEKNKLAAGDVLGNAKAMAKMKKQVGGVQHLHRQGARWGMVFVAEGHGVCCKGT